MEPEPFVNEIHHAARKQRRRWRRSTEQAPDPRGLHVASIDRSVNVSDALDRPMIALLLTEDLCWQSNVTDWRARRPRRWQRAQWAAWRAEGAIIEEKRARIRELAVDAGVVAR